jgi:hypothetical protein
VPFANCGSGCLSCGGASHSAWAACATRGLSPEPRAPTNLAPSRAAIRRSRCGNTARKDAKLTFRHNAAFVPPARPFAIEWRTNVGICTARRHSFKKLLDVNNATLGGGAGSFPPADFSPLVLYPAQREHS